MTIVLVDGGEVEAGLGWSALTHSPGAAPSVPQALAAANGAVDPSDIVVTWSEPADKGGWSMIEGYEVELTTPASQEFMPAMTADNAPAPYVVSASGTLNATTYAAWKAFDDVYVPVSPTNQTTGWYSQDSAPPWWLKIDLGSQKQIVGFYWSKTMTTHQYAIDHFPKAWQLQGSNDNSVWTTVHSETTYAMSGTGFDMYVPVSTPGSYRYYRWWITDCQAADMTHVGIDEIRLVEGGEPTVELQTKASSPVTFPAKSLGKTYNIRARAKNIVEWSAWTAPVRYLHLLGDVVFMANQNLFTDVAGTIPVTSANDPVNAWRDIQSGILATCNTTATPKYTEDGVRFGSSGGKERLRFALPQGFTAGFSIFVVAKFLSYGYNNTILTLEDNGTWSSTSTIALVRAYNAAYDAVFHGGSSGNDINMGQYPLNTNCLISLVYDGSDKLSAYVNGELKQTKSVGAKTASALAYCSFGSLAWETTEWGNFYLKEVQISQRPYNTTEIAGIHTSLKSKYGIS